MFPVAWPLQALAVLFKQENWSPQPHYSKATRSVQIQKFSLKQRRDGAFNLGMASWWERGRLCFIWHFDSIGNWGVPSSKPWLGIHRLFQMLWPRRLCYEATQTQRPSAALSPSLGLTKVNDTRESGGDPLRGNSADSDSEEPPTK